jgi:hypothetical protein
MKKSIILLFVLLLANVTLIYSQQVVQPDKLNVKFTITPLGDAHIDVSKTMDALHWDNYKQMIGSNPDIWKRQMERYFPGYFLQNFNYKEDVMNRSWTLSFDALGFSKVNSKGKWQIDLNSKNPDVTKLSDRNFVVNTNATNGYAISQEIDNVTFPDAAYNVIQDKDAEGKALFTYEISSIGSGGYTGWISLIFGFLLLVAGAVLFFLLNKPVKQKAAAPAPVV